MQQKIKLEPARLPGRKWLEQRASAGVSFRAPAGGSLPASALSSWAANAASGTSRRASAAMRAASLGLSFNTSNATRMLDSRVKLSRITGRASLIGWLPWAAMSEYWRQL
jgi:hypothetical protein